MKASHAVLIVSQISVHIIKDWVKIKIMNIIGFEEFNISALIIKDKTRVIFISVNSLIKILALEVKDVYTLFWSFYNKLIFSLQD